jgi:hypothetical protein
LVCHLHWAVRRIKGQDIKETAQGVSSFNERPHRQPRFLG